MSTLCNCNRSDKSIKTDKDPQAFTYFVYQTDMKPDINAVWKKKFWKKTDGILLQNYMGEKPSHFPETQAKVKYDDKNLYVIFTVKDRYVRAVAKEINGRVYEDSCVEFFFTPGPDISRGYFNLEMNCKGVFLFNWHRNGNQEKGPLDTSDNSQITVSCSLKEDVTEEIDKPVDWTIEYCIPFSILKKYMEVDMPAPGVVWKANFYKCGDKTSHPHWLTWAPVDFPTPKFHLPEFFGTIIFK